MSKYTDAVYHKPGTDPLRRVRIYWESEEIISACGRGISLDFGSSHVFEEGEFTEGFLKWLQDSGRRVYALCCHCQNRDFKEGK